MTNYPFEMQLVVDPTNPRNVVAGGSVSIYDSADTGHTTLLALTDPNGVPITNPITSNANGFTEPFVTTSPQVLWVSGEYVDYFNSYVGMRNEALAAKTASETAASNAGAAAVADLDARIASGVFKGEKGADGSNVLPTDTAVKDAIANPASLTRGELNATYALKGEGGGGALLTVANAVGEYAWNYPMAMYRTSPAPRTYFGASDAQGNLLACYLEHSTGRVRRQVIGTSIVDDHHVPTSSAPVNAPQLWVWNNHNTDSIVSYRVGDRTGDLDTLGPVRTVSSGGNVSYAHILRNPADPLDVWMLNRTWPASSPYDWSIRRGTINETTKDVAWAARKTFIQFPTAPSTVQGYVTVAPITHANGDYGFRFAATGNPTNGEFHDVLYGTVNLVSGAVESPGKTLTANVLTGTGLPLQVTDLDTAYAPPAGWTSRTFAVRDTGVPAVAVAAWDPAVAGGPIEYFHRTYNGAGTTGDGLTLPTATAYATTPAPVPLQSAQNLSIRFAANITTTAATRSLARRYGTAGQHVWQVSMLSTDKLRLQIYPDGTTATTFDSTVAVTVTPGTVQHYRLDINAAGFSVAFYTSPDGVTWTQVGTTVTGTATSLFNSTLPVQLGAASAGFAGAVKSINIKTIDQATTYLNHNFRTDDPASWSLFNSASITRDVAGGWAGESLGLAGVPFGLATTSRYVGGLAYPTPAKGDTIYRARESAGTWLLEKVSKESGAWVTRVLDSSTTHKLARPMPIENQGPLETIYSAFTEYAGFQSFQGDYRAV